MTVRIPAEVAETLSVIGRQSDSRMREVARVFVYLKELEAELGDGRTSLEFWNVRDSAAGLLESRCTLKSGASVWRLYPQTNKHAVVLLACLEGQIQVLAVCSRRSLEAVERRLADLTL
jgi:hypothetical protein